MPINYFFKDSTTADRVAKALLFVARFSKHQALVKFSDSSVSVVWGGSPKTYYIHAEATALDMFRNKKDIRHYGIDHCTIVQINPTVLGKTLRGCGSDKTVVLRISRPNKIQIEVEYTDLAAPRVITHTIPCDMKTLDDYKLMLIEEIESKLCRYNTRSYVDCIHRYKRIVESFVRLNTSRIYIMSRNTDLGLDLSTNAKNQGSDITVNLAELEDGFHELPVQNYEDENYDYLQQPAPRRSDAGVYIDTKKLSSFLSGLVAYKRNKVCFDIEHNKCLKITLDHEVTQGEKFYQSLLLLHSIHI